jgi:hypothetical protein
LVDAGGAHVDNATFEKYGNDGKVRFVGGVEEGGVGGGRGSEAFGDFREVVF